MSGFYSQNLNFSPARNIISSPHLGANVPDARSQYLTELLTEKQKLEPFMEMVPICKLLLDQEIMKASESLMINSNVVQGLSDYDMMQLASPSRPVASLDLMPDIGVRGGAIAYWNRNCNVCRMQHEIFGEPHDMIVDSCAHWAPAASSSPLMVKKALRVEVPVELYPNFNFVGRLLGPRGNSLKRVEVSTDCRVYIRGRGSIKDPRKEESLRGKPGFEHLNEPLHVVIEANLPPSIIDARLIQAKEIIEELLKPVDESQDAYKKEQLRELAMLNRGTTMRASPKPITRGGTSRSASAASPFTYASGGRIIRRSNTN